MTIEKILTSTRSFKDFAALYNRKGNIAQRVSSNSSLLNLLFSYLSFKRFGFNTYYFSFSPYVAQKHHQMLTSIFDDDKILLLSGDDQGQISVESLFKFYSSAEPRFIILPFEFVFRKIPSKRKILNSVLHLSTGSQLQLEQLYEHLKKSGFTKKSIVWEMGEFSIRGDTVDIFPYGSDEPLRIEFLDDRIEAIYCFNPETHEKGSEISDFTMVPEEIECQKKEDLQQRFNRNDIAVLDNVEKTRERLSFLMGEKLLRKIDEPIERFESITSKRTILKTFSMISSLDYNTEFLTYGLINFANNTQLFARTFEKWLSDEQVILFFVRNPNRVGPLKEIVSKVLFNIKTNPKIYFFKGDVPSGFVYSRENMVFVSEKDLLSSRRESSSVQRGPTAQVDKELKNINAGDYIVHEDYGIGRFRGIENRRIASHWGDFFVIEYKNRETLYLPIDKLSKVHKYISGGGYHPVLDSLRSGAWDKKKARAVQGLERMLLSIAKLYAEREVTQGFSFSGDSDMHRDFYDSFAYEDTEDQKKVVEEISKDMESAKPMDRLLVGDVGFGKTEVAMRAAFKAVFDGKQVAVLAPTTVLCEQHLITFRNRFERYGISVAMLSRMLTTAEAKQVVKNLARGGVDILIGTHRLLSKDVKFKDLGLLIIDEEQRFGVKAKENIKILKKDIDALTMSATPIPRTLYMSLSRIRPLSVIETAPPGRRAVKTIISLFDRDVLKSAILEEVKRGGQIFFVHNNIKELERMKALIKEIIPSISILTLHGRMSTGQIEEKMKSFQRGLYDLLLSTTIIEIGIDLPNVNTIIINNGENFGLSQLYQLRGRVGRSHRQAYAYIFVDSLERMTPDAVKRLSAIREYQDLGSGSRLAMKDLEIRGIGNIFGAQQSGNVANIGLGMYLKILNRLIEKLKRGEVLMDTELDIGVLPYIPKEFIPLHIERQRLYLEIVNCRSEDKLESIRRGLYEVYNNIPEKVNELFEYQWIKIKALENQISAVSYKNNVLTISSSATAEKVFHSVKSMFKIDVKRGKDQVKVSLPPGNILKTLRNILKNLA